MTLSTLARRLRAAEAASQALAAVALLPLVPLWLEVVRTLGRGNETLPPEAVAAHSMVRAAMQSLKAHQQGLSQREAELVDACVRVLRTLPLAELRPLAGSRLPRLPGIEEAEPVKEKGNRR